MVCSSMASVRTAAVGRTDRPFCFSTASCNAKTGVAAFVALLALTVLITGVLAHIAHTLPPSSSPRGLELLRAIGKIEATLMIVCGGGALFTALGVAFFYLDSNFKETIDKTMTATMNDELSLNQRGFIWEHADRARRARYPREEFNRLIIQKIRGDGWLLEDIYGWGPKKAELIMKHLSPLFPATWQEAQALKITPRIC